MPYLKRRKNAKLKKGFRNRKIVILQDDREKYPFVFDTCKYQVVRQRLKTGDYTIQGLENKVIIEKKSSWTEFLYNISGADRKRFLRSLRRLADFPCAILVIEDCIKNLPKVVANIPHTRLTVDSVYYWLTRIQVEYNIKVLLTGTRADHKRRFLDQIMKVILEANL